LFAIGEALGLGLIDRADARDAQAPALGRGEPEALGEDIGAPSPRLLDHVIKHCLEFGGGGEPRRVGCAPCGAPLAWVASAASEMVQHDHHIGSACVVIGELVAIPGGEQALEFGAAQARHAEPAACPPPLAAPLAEKSDGHAAPRARLS
jgi:hypothetical protein